MDIITERIDDIPLIMGLAIKIGIASLVDKHFGTHGSQEGLNNGELLVGWLAYILSQGDHKKSDVQDWANDLKETIGGLLGKNLREIEFSDDRLSNLARRFSNDANWLNFERALWDAAVSVYNIETKCIRLDSTTSYGYHKVNEDGFMQFGVSKDHRPDLPQLKLMAGCSQPSGHLIGVDIHPGNYADDRLYVPLIQRIRNVLNKPGMLYAGDCKMASLEIRADLVSHGDYYLVPLALTGNTKQEFETWIASVVEGEQAVECLYDGDRLLGMGYEFTREEETVLNGEKKKWSERVQILRSPSLAHSKAEHLENRISKATENLFNLTPKPGKGKRQISSIEQLNKTVEETLSRQDVVGLLTVKWQEHRSNTLRYKGKGRGGANREKIEEEVVRYEITEVIRDEKAVERTKNRYGWRVHVTNAPVEKLNLSQSVSCYRQGNILERDFHLLKDMPIGIGPLYVWKEDQIKGLTRILTLALRLLTLIEIQVREGIKKEGEPMKGLYNGQPTKATDKPTGKRILKAFAKAKITLTNVQVDNNIQRHIKPLSPLLHRILQYLQLPVSIYTELKYYNST
jgi:transposase